MADAVMKAKLEEFRAKKAELEMGGGPSRVDAQHNKGKLTARERLGILFDPGTFQEIDLFVEHQCREFGMEGKKVPGDAVITGFGDVQGRRVAAYAQDFTSMGGTVGEWHGNKIAKLYDKAYTMGVPVVGLIDSGGVRAQETLGGYIAYARMFHKQVSYSGVLPQISLILGPCGGGASYSPALTDFIFMTRSGASFMYIAGPALTHTVTGESFTEAELGGPDVHSKVSGCCDLVAQDDADCLEQCRRLLSYLPSNNGAKPPIVDTGDDPFRESPELEDLVPGNEQRAYDMRKVIQCIVDKDSFFELKPEYATQFITGLARIGGYPIGLLANQPKILAGSMDIDASDKAARFIRLCNSFDVPLVNLVDVPGYLPGIEQERGGIIRHGAKMLHAYVEATTAKIHVVLRKGFAGASHGMCSKEMGADMVYIWPCGAILTMGPRGAAEIVFKKQIDGASPEDRSKITQSMEDEYRQLFYNPFRAASVQQVDEIIEPRETRGKIYTAVRYFWDKKEDRPWKRNGNMPI
ncbi:MAG: methylmalonyl-CoA carboxyltransferase [Deltaproteobacteria bacterium]|nr:methylmalonyl-CoA carboxyltransferase [Deltaproteobacteria bacterium]